MANNIVLKTYKGGNVTPQDDAIIQETAIPMNGIFKGCEVSHARGNVLRVSQGFGMIKGRFFEVYESEIAVQLADAGQTLNGRIYIHMDLSNADEPIMLLGDTAVELPVLDADADVNYNNSSFDLQLAAFSVTSSGISNLTQTFSKLAGGAGGGGGNGNTLLRDTVYAVGDTALVSAAPGWVTLVCTQEGKTASAEPTSYATIQNVGDSILDGTCVFVARNVIGELDGALKTIRELDTAVSDLGIRVDEALSSSGNLITRIISLTDYRKLESYDENCIYLCYSDENTKKVERIYLGENKVYSEGVKVTFQTDTGESETIHVDDGEDALLLAPSAALEGYTLLGWRRNTTAEGKVLNSCIVEEETDFTLYAVFQTDIEVNMYPNGGTLIEGKTESIIKSTCYYNNGNTGGSQAIVPVCPYEKKGESFCGWNCNGTTYKPGEKADFVEGGFIVPEWVTTVYDFPYTGTYVPFTIPADGIYEFEVWGAEGASITKDTAIGKGGLGGHAKGYKKMTKGQQIYIYNGGKPSSANYGGTNGGASGYSYSTNNGYGAGGGGATSIMTRSGAICSSSNSSAQSTNYKNRETEILIVAGGGGGGGITSSGVANNGGDGGGERGGDGSGGALGGRQISTGSYEYANFGCALSYSGSNTTYSGGGGGYFGGNYALRGESAAGGSGYVGGVAAFTHNKKFYGTVNESGINEENGYAYIRYVECV